MTDTTDHDDRITDALLSMVEHGGFDTLLAAARQMGDRMDPQEPTCLVLQPKQLHALIAAAEVGLILLDEMEPEAA